MGVEGAVNIIFRDEHRRRRMTRRGAGATGRTNTRQTFANPYVAAARGYVDDVILPSETRPRVIARAGDARRQARRATRRKKHGNIPL